MNWTSKELKKKGLESLNKNFIRAYIVVLTVYMITDIPIYFFSMDGRVSGLTRTGAVLALVCVLTAAVFGGTVLSVGENAYFLKQRENRAEYSVLWGYFTDGMDRYFSVVKGMFFRYLKVLAWTLVFVIPGIMAYYSTFFVPWILAENPDMQPGTAIEKSKLMTKGHKMDIFIMQLTFAGWFILSIFLVYRFNLVLPAVWGHIVSIAVYALPLVYYQATAAELYVKLV